MNYFVQVFLIISIFSTSINCSDNEKIAAARIESCPGCSLNRLSEVKQFIYQDVPNYENVEFKKIHGAPPELVLLNEEDKEIERIPLSKLNRQECNDLLIQKGFKVLEATQDRHEF